MKNTGSRLQPTVEGFGSMKEVENGNEMSMV